MTDKANENFIVLDATDGDFISKLSKGLGLDQEMAEKQWHPPVINHEIDDKGMYRGYHIDAAYVGFSFAIKDWDLDDPRIGHGNSIEDCQEQIDEQILEGEEDE